MFEAIVITIVFIALIGFGLARLARAFFGAMPTLDQKDSVADRLTHRNRPRHFDD